MITSNYYDDDSISFYVSKGTYNFNLDTLTFSSPNTATFALAQKGVKVNHPTQIKFDFKLLNNFTVKINSVK